MPQVDLPEMDAPVLGEPELSLVIPTRNEARNMVYLMESIRVALHGIAYEVILVDDSEDETPMIARASARKGHPVRVLHRDLASRKGGLGGAVLLGFRVARGTFIGVLDADLQHPPSVIPLLLAAARDGADIVVASRYCPGGSPGGLDGRMRQLSSIVARQLSWWVIPRSLAFTDPLGGFFMVRTSLIQQASFEPVGFKILLEVIARTAWSVPFEVPYCFASRKAERSKFSTRESLTYLLHLWRLACFTNRFGRPGQRARNRRKRA